MYENVLVLIQLLQIRFYVYCYIQGRHSLHNLHRRSLAVRFLFFFNVLSKMGTYIPVSISKGRIPVLNCDSRELTYT